MIVFTLRKLIASILRLDFECMGTKVITLGLEQVGGQILGAVAIVEAQSGAESWCGNTPLGTLGHDISPTFLSVVDGLVEEVVEQ